jgi:hypothetical protein
MGKYGAQVLMPWQQKSGRNDGSDSSRAKMFQDRVPPWKEPSQNYEPIWKRGKGEAGPGEAAAPEPAAVQPASDGGKPKALPPKLDLGGGSAPPAAAAKPAPPKLDLGGGAAQPDASKGKAVPKLSIPK